MGSSLSSISSPPPTSPQLQVKDVLVLCEDGDLLLAREKLADATLRVGVDFVVARDIQRMQCGQFPAQRVTSLPPWTSCDVLLRHEGALHVVTVGANGLQLIPFEERIASKMPHIHDRFAVRRLHHDAGSESLSAELRELALQIASIAPISWHSLLFPNSTTTMSPRSPRQQPVDRDAVTNALKELPPVVRQLLRRTLELFCQGLTQGETALAPTKEVAVCTLHPESAQTNSTLTTDDDALRVALETLGIAEVTARLSAAFVAALYERLHLVGRISATTTDPLLPTAFWSAYNDRNRVNFTLPTALGTEVALAKK